MTGSCRRLLLPMVGAKGKARPVCFAPGKVKDLTPLVVPHGQLCSSKLSSEAAVEDLGEKRDAMFVVI